MLFIHGREVPQIVDVGIKDALAEFNIRRSPFTIIAERRVEKIDEFLAYLGGLLSSFLLAIGFLIYRFKEKALSIEIANKLY